MSRIFTLPRSEVTIDTNATRGPLEWWRQAIGHGGINSKPLPARVIEGTRKLKPRLVRIFLQEFFFINSNQGQFDWTRLNPYMDSFADTGAAVVAAITFKPPTLYPAIDPTIWKPNDVAAWQALIFELVKRYSVDKQIVTYWEVGNETDIGEMGGCPYLLQDPVAYAEYYEMTIAPILKAFPEAKVGGPGVAGVENEPLQGLIAYCRETGTQLDFVSWHRYDDSTPGHTGGVDLVKRWLAGYPGTRPEMLITEWNNGFPPISVEDAAFEPRGAANVATTILAYIESGVDWTFYYHLWDQVCYPEEFQPFFSEAGVAEMMHHWNKGPHRMGLFGVGEEVRPPYFVYQMLSRLGDERVSAQSDDPGVRVLAAQTEHRVGALVVNFDPSAPQDRVVTVRFPHLTPGHWHLTTYRIDSDQRWSKDTLELIPVERREVANTGEFHCQIYCPGDSVVMVTLEASV